MSALTFRTSRAEDLPILVAMLVDDVLGRGREAANALDDPRYRAAFDAIASDQNQMLLVAERDGAMAGFLQITFIPGLARAGMWRGQIESVRVHRDHRGQGIGHAMMREAIAECRRRGCGMVQLATDKSRADAHRFYADLGFEASHEGMKLFIS
jgi:ribosomal protein S18 acetylase RimI-like enzyme